MKHQGLKDKELIRRQELLCQRYPDIRKLVALLGVPVDDREDVVQEIFIIACIHLDQLRDVESLNSWLYKLACRHIKDTLKKRSKKAEFEISYEENPWVLEQVDAKTVWNIAENCLNDQELVDMIDSLKPPAPTILQLRFAMGFNLTEIAEMMDMNYNTVKTIENRAFKKLKKMIEERGERNDENQENHKQLG